MKFTDCGARNWCGDSAIDYVLYLNGIFRKEILSSKGKKRLQEANMSLEKLGIELDKERARLARALGDFAAGGSFETTLHSLADNLTGFEASLEFYPEILTYSKRLERLEAEVCRSLLVRDLTHPV